MIYNLALEKNEDWKVKPLNEVSSYISRGKQPKYVGKSDIYTLNQKAIQWGQIVPEYLKFHNPSVNVDEKHFIRKNDVVINSTGTGTAGRVYHFDNDPEIKMFADSHVTIVRTDEKQLLTKFLMYQLASDKYQDLIINTFLAGSTGQVELNKSKVQEFPILIPPLEVQKGIVHILASLDFKIVENRKIIATLEEISQTLFKRWFIEFEFPNEEGLPYKSSGGKMVESELGEIPAEWKLGAIGDLGSVIGGGTPSKKEESYYTQNGISWITPKDLSNNKSKFIYRGAVDITELGLAKGSAKLMPEGSVLFSSRAPIGYIAFAGKEVSTNQGFKSIVSDKGYSNYFIYFVLHQMLPIIESNAGGSTFKEISGQGLKSIGIVLPPVKLVEEYSNLVKVLFEQIKTTEIENDKLLNIRDALLPKLLSGEIEIPDESVVD